MPRYGALMALDINVEVPVDDDEPLKDGKASPALMGRLEHAARLKIAAALAPFEVTVFEDYLEDVV